MIVNDNWSSCKVPVIIFLIYIQQDATLHSLFLSGNCSTCFGWYHHPSSGAQTTVSTESGICHTIIAIYRYRGTVGTGLSVLWVAYAADSNNGVTNTRFRGYSCLRSWWWVMVPPETCKQFPDKNKLCNVASCWIYIRILLQCTDPWTLKKYPLILSNFN